MWKAKDTTGYRQALNGYERAFKKYPDSIDNLGLYKASVLASDLNDFENAFNYLTLLLAPKDKNDSYPGWTYILSKYAKSEYKSMLDKPKWNELTQKALVDKTKFYKELQKNEDEFYAITKTDLLQIEDAKDLYEAIKNYNPYLVKKRRDYSISFAINDSTRTSFFVHLPAGYTPKKSYALLFFLHGAVRNNALVDFQTAENNLHGWNRFYTKYAEQNDVILVFPKGSRKYNWMLPDDGFFMIPEMIKQIKRAINVDDNKIFISGHSNGATGAFSYLMKQPTPFAGFYGFNTYPKVFTGGTYIENIRNRSFINFSTDEDYYYPPNANDCFTQLMDSIKADYHEHRYEGFPHWFPEFDESESAYKILFKDLATRKRNPFPQEISWEFDNNKYGSIDWLSDIILDTSTEKADWHRELNFKIHQWLEYDKNDSLISKNVDKNAFDFPYRSGKIKAQYANNVFRIETSRVKSLRLNISPDMVDTKKKIKVFINGKEYFHGRISYDRRFILQHFEKDRDRKQIWINSIELNIKNTKTDALLISYSFVVNSSLTFTEAGVYKKFYRVD
ncbi:hypothetical protein GCM10023231_12220 [Olivibacter ginsenosidimutans]|uniref:Phospholipase n=2 Tax=Olivibacter ginsenosidimutans TaxID=1176537 RepID=A0ABP9ATV2_9SPHI